MKYVAALAILIFFSLPSLADKHKMTEDQRDSIKIALGMLGCEGGEIEKENNGSVTYEVDDAECKNGTFDIEFDYNFELNKMERD